MVLVMSENVLNAEKIRELSLVCDELIIAHDHKRIKEQFELLSNKDYEFDRVVDEVGFYYLLGNCAQALYTYDNLAWYSDDLTKAVIFFRKALYIFSKIESPTHQELFLKSSIQTNLGNNLSSQCRVFCCIPLWDSAFESTENPVAIIAKATNAIFIAGIVYDPGHSGYYAHTAYNLIHLGIEYFDYLNPEQQIAYSEGSNFIKFSDWFVSNHKYESFEDFDLYKNEVGTKKEGDYLKWCGENRLFLNELNDISKSEIVYQDSMGLPPFSTKINQCLTMYEGLVYHGHFDELKNDYCYARYLTFSAKNIPNDNKHFFNNTYPHVDDMSHSLTNLKASHYKSAFRTLYSIFDKIAFFMNRFFELNKIEDDSRISFDSIFKDLKSNKKWKPNAKLLNTQNRFIRALFFILKDIRDVKDSSSVSRWLDPDAKAFSEIRNSIEHRSLKIVDDSMYDLAQGDVNVRKQHIDELDSKIVCIEGELEQLYSDIAIAKKTKNSPLKTKLEDRKEILQVELTDAISKKNEKNKLSSHSVLITESEFYSRLLSLMKLARNSIMYLSLAVHDHEKSKVDYGQFKLPVQVPLK